VTASTRSKWLWACVSGVLVGLGGCGDPSRAWLKNDTDTVLRVRFWSGPRETAMDPSTLTPSEVYDVDPGDKLTLQLDESVGFASPSESIVRIQAEPLGAGFKRVVQYWFEINPPGPYGMKAIGVRPDIRAERDGTGNMRMVPPEHWPVPVSKQ